MSSGIYGNVSNGNYSEFEPDTWFLVSYGSDMVWEDLRIPGSQVGTGASAPDQISFVGGNLKGY